MRRAARPLPVVLLISVVPACHKEPAPAPPVFTTVSPLRRPIKFHPPQKVPPLPDHPDAGASLAALEASLDHFARFSGDGLVFAYTLPGPGRTPVLYFESVPTGTEEKQVVLATPEQRKDALEALQDANVALGPAEERVPPQVGVTLHDGQVVLTFGGVPAAKTWKPFEGADVKVQGVDVVAVTHNGRYVAVRATGTMAMGATVTAYHVFPLFG